MHTKRDALGTLRNNLETLRKWNTFSLLRLLLVGAKTRSFECCEIWIFLYLNLIREAFILKKSKKL